MVYKCKLADYSKAAVYKCKLPVYTCKVLNSRFTTVILITLLDTVEVTPFFQIFVCQKGDIVKDPMKSIPFVPKTIPGVGWGGWGRVGVG